MHLTVYIDVYFFVNVCMDFTLLAIVKKIGRCNSTYIKMSLAALLGGCGSCLSLMMADIPPVLRVVLFYILTGWGMLLTAFGYQGIRIFATQVLELYLTAFLMNGLCDFIYYHKVTNQLIKNIPFYSVWSRITVWNLMEAAGCMIVFLPLCGALCQQTVKKSKLFHEVSIGYRENQVNGLGLVDTGNLLLDPVTRRPVFIVEYEFVKNLFSEKEKQTLELFMEQGFSQETVEADSHLAPRMVPFHSIGRENGLLITVTVDYLETDMREKPVRRENVLIGLYPGKLSSQGKYQVILHV